MPDFVYCNAFFHLPARTGEGISFPSRSNYLLIKPLTVQKESRDYHIILMPMNIHLLLKIQPKSGCGCIHRIHLRIHRMLILYYYFCMEKVRGREDNWSQAG